MKKETLKKLAKPLIFPLAVGIVAWEELFYKPIKFVSNFLERNKIIHKVSEKIRHSNPYVALGILACAGLPLVPFKIAGLYLVGHGYTVLGIGTFGLAKVVGGAISVQMFNLTEPAIRKIKFVNTALDWTFDKKNKIKKVVTDSPHYIAAQNQIREVKANIKEFVINNTYFQKAKSLFKKKSNSEMSSEIKEVTSIDITQTVIVAESTIVERISAKVETMSHSVASMIEEPQIIVVETTKTEVVQKEDHQHFKNIAVHTQVQKPQEQNSNKMHR